MTFRGPYACFTPIKNIRDRTWSTWALFNKAQYLFLTNYWAIKLSGLFDTIIALCVKWIKCSFVAKQMVFFSYQSLDLMIFSRYSNYSLLRQHIAHKLATWGTNKAGRLVRGRYSLVSLRWIFSEALTSKISNLLFSQKSASISWWKEVQRPIEIQRFQMLTVSKNWFLPWHLPKKNLTAWVRKGMPSVIFFKLIALIAGDSILCDKLSWQFVTFYEWSVDESWWAHTSINPL